MLRVGIVFSIVKKFVGISVNYVTFKKNNVRYTGLK